MTTWTVEQALLSGWQARQNGARPGSNPFVDFDLGVAWATGWHIRDAQIRHERDLDEGMAQQAHLAGIREGQMRKLWRRAG